MRHGQSLQSGQVVGSVFAHYKHHAGDIGAAMWPRARRLRADPGAAPGRPWAQSSPIMVVVAASRFPFSPSRDGQASGASSGSDRDIERHTCRGSRPARTLYRCCTGVGVGVRLGWPDMGEGWSGCGGMFVRWQFPEAPAV